MRVCLTALPHGSVSPPAQTMLIKRAQARGASQFRSLVAQREVGREGLARRVRACPAPRRASVDPRHTQHRPGRDSGCKQTIGCWQERGRLCVAGGPPGPERQWMLARPRWCRSATSPPSRSSRRSGVRRVTVRVSAPKAPSSRRVCATRGRVRPTAVTNGGHRLAACWLCGSRRVVGRIGTIRIRLGSACCA